MYCLFKSTFVQVMDINVSQTYPQMVILKPPGNCGQAKKAPDPWEKACLTKIWEAFQLRYSTALKGLLLFTAHIPLYFS